MVKKSDSDTGAVATPAPEEFDRNLRGRLLEFAVGNNTEFEAIARATNMTELGDAVHATDENSDLGRGLRAIFHGTE